MIGGKVGIVLEVDLIAEHRILWKSFVRCRVNINIAAPFCPGMFLPRSDRSDMWISLKYERLLDVCFRCGSLGHTEAYCENERATLSNEFGFKFPAFGDWLKVDNDKVPLGNYEHPPERQPSVDLGSGALPSVISEVAELDIRTSEVAVRNDIPLLVVEDM